MQYKNRDLNLRPVSYTICQTVILIDFKTWGDMWNCDINIFFLISNTRFSANYEIARKGIAGVLRSPAIEGRYV